MKNDYHKRASAIMQRIDELASISEDPNGITRIFGTEAFVKGRRLVAKWMEQAALQTRIDHIGNVRGKLLSHKANAKTLVIASHIDTVIDAGKFDGPLGVIMGLNIIEHLIGQQTALPFHIELIAFCDEEGVRFHTTLLGSKVVAGTFDSNLLDNTDHTGTTLRQVIQAVGGRPNEIQLDAIPAGNWLGYFEIHIEQGPVLYESNTPVAVVTAIAGQKRIAITFRGEAGHAGTVPMHMRNDALCAASEFILATEQFAKNSKHGVVATIGKLDITHAASNVIPGEVTCTLDVRSSAETVLSSCYQNLQQMAGEICRRRNLTMEWVVVQETKPVTCDAGMNQLLAESVVEAGYTIIELVSGAGHDAVAVAPVSPVAMLFVRCYKGISHNPLENVELPDIAAAVEVCDTFIKKLIQKYQH